MEYVLDGRIETEKKMTIEKLEDSTVKPEPEKEAEVVDTTSEEEPVNKNEEGKIEIPELTTDQSTKILKDMEGVVFKVGPAFFKVTYQNFGQRRFTASMINDIKK